ncbi:hypothetical protein ILUMI_16135, partial [Ignelater luminosus]
KDGTISWNKHSPPNANPTKEVEIKALIGLLYIAGVYKANRLNIEDLWQTDGSEIEFFCLTMPIQKFRKIGVYVGKQPDGPHNLSNSSSYVVYRLCGNIRNPGRNLTTDNWFTSILLAQTLLQDYKLTTISTIKKNKTELPLEFSKPVPRPALVDKHPHQVIETGGYKEQETLANIFCCPLLTIILWQPCESNTNTTDLSDGICLRSGGTTE